ncbi:MAG: hypothetical protein LBL15_06985 [Oscillospiraceae bacterium]|jgi:hypothetical protein|nr:hypothetical protein [Oscillospiraceae bacterium]
MLKKKMVIGIALVCMLVLGAVSASASAGAIGFRRLTPDEYEAIGGQLVTPEEYEAIQNGEVRLDDGVPRLWSNPDAAEEVGISVH